MEEIKSQYTRRERMTEFTRKEINILLEAARLKETSLYKGIKETSHQDIKAMREEKLQNLFSAKCKLARLRSQLK
jgi:hypothetical protein